MKNLLVAVFSIGQHLQTLLPVIEEPVFPVEALQLPMGLLNDFKPKYGQILVIGLSILFF